MIGFIKGQVFDVRGNSVIIMTDSGVGYEVHAAGSLMEKCKQGAHIEAEIYTLVREQELSLYGFGSRDEKELFVKLLSVSGIGPKTAIQLASIPPGQFTNAVAEGDVDFLTRTPGLGKKTAQKLIVELRGKLDLSADAPITNTALQEAFDGLQALGYDQNTIQRVLKDAPDDANAEDLIKFFLGQRS